MPARLSWTRLMILAGPESLRPMAPSTSTRALARQLGPHPDSASWCEALLEEHGVAPHSWHSTSTSGTVAPPFDSRCLPARRPWLRP